MPRLPDHTSPTLAAIHARRVANAVRLAGEEGESPFIRASKAHNDCVRAIWYDFRWASPGEDWTARMLRLFGTGHMEETRIVDDLRAAGMEIFDQQIQVDIAGYIRGHIDGKIGRVPDAPKTVHLLECKTANDKSFASIKAKKVERGKPEHWTQIQLYMRGAGLTRCLYFLVNKNTDEEYVERIKPDVEATERAIARLVSIAEAPRPPTKFREDASKPPCLFCRHKGICHEGQSARTHCRTCLSATPRPGGTWWCEHWKIELTPEDQGEGCPAHLFIPELVAGEQIDASTADRTVTYRLKSGETWVDGAGRAA